MVESSEGGGPESGPGYIPASSFESAGGRMRFTVELRPGETTIVSWKKLQREANLSNSARPGPVLSGPLHGTECEHAPPAPTVPPSSSSPKKPTENEAKDSQAQPGSNRLSTVIERIERMYAGNGSSDEEDVVLDNMPDEDEYDTDDSFIDDVELDEYFQVDNSTVKHDGFFVNRGKLDRVEPTMSENQQPKKRRRKDLTRSDGHNPSEVLKIGNKRRKPSSLNQGNSTSQSHRVAIPTVPGGQMQFQAPANTPEVPSKKKALNQGNSKSHRVAIPNVPGGEMQFQAPASASEVPSKKKAADIQTTVGTLEMLNVDSTQDMDAFSQEPGVLTSKNHVSKQGESEGQDTSTQRSTDKNSRKDVLMQRKEGSNVKPKSTSLDKAIRELEEKVAEFRPPSAEAPDPDNSSQAVKRRLTPEIKQKLAKVARLTQSIYGKIPKDVVSRLMGIVGHLMQIRTLKRNLNAMANMGLSAKQEKDERIQRIKQEVEEMIKLRIPHMKSKVEQQAANSNDLQEAGKEDKAALKRKYNMDDALENKICDLYDLYVERVEEDSGPPVRRLYRELLALMPSGFMDTDGIKRAIYRAKDRRRLCSPQKDRQKIKKQKVEIPKADVAVNVTQTWENHEKVLPDSHIRSSSSMPKPVLSAAARIAKGAFIHKPKQAKVKDSSSKSVKLMPSNEVPKKKVKRKPNAEVVSDVEFLFQLRQKHHKHVAVAVAPLTKSSLQAPVPSGS